VLPEVRPSGPASFAPAVERVRARRDARLCDWQLPLLVLLHRVDGNPGQLSAETESPKFAPLDECPDVVRRALPAGRYLVPQ
jgi:hypothetical protein